MLVIRPQQIDALGVTRRSAFVAKLVERFREEFPVHYAAIGDTGLQGAVEEAMAWGPKVGVDTFGGISVLAELVLVYGPELRDSPDRLWAMEIFAHPTMPAQLKVRLVRDRLDARSGGRRIVKINA